MAWPQSLCREEDEQSIAKYEEELKTFEDFNKGGFRLVMGWMKNGCLHDFAVGEFIQRITMK